MERLIKAKKEKYLLILTIKGVRLPEDFDPENLRNKDERIFRTRSRNYTYQEPQREETPDPEIILEKNTILEHNHAQNQDSLNEREEALPRCTNALMVALTQKIKMLQRQMEDM